MDLVNANAWVTIKATALWWSPVVAGFVGAFGVHVLTRSREKEAWIRNCEKEEWKELLSALTKAEFALAMLASAIGQQIRPFGGEGHKYLEIYEGAVADAYRVLHDRLFIQDVLDERRLSEQWDLIQTGISKEIHRSIITSKDALLGYSGEFGRVKRLMRDAALRPASRRGIWQRIWNK